MWSSPGTAIAVGAFAVLAKGYLAMADGGVQKQAFLDGEGDAYFWRNQSREFAGENDPILRVMNRLKLRAASVLEIGCGDCARLATIRASAQTKCFGVDPSKAAIELARERFPDLNLEVGTADSLPFPNDFFDLVIFGFCLYLVDPIDYFSVAREADRVLSDGGALIIYDFCTPTPYANEYVHLKGIVTRKMEWRRMFTWNPAYNHLVRELASSERGELHEVDGRVTVDVIVKNLNLAFPLSR